MRGLEKNRAWLAPVTLLSMTLGLAACGGGDSNIQASSTTIGQELMDLDASYQQGLITEREYQKTKEAILERYR